MEVLDSTRSRAGRELRNEPRVRGDLYWSMANSYRAFGRPELAIELLDSARLLHTASVGDPSLEVARDLHFTGLVHQYVGRNDEAIAKFREAMGRYNELRVVPDTERTDIEGSLGQMLVIARQAYAEGDSLLRSAVRREQAQVAPRADLLRVLQGAVATSFMLQGILPDADSAFAEADASYARDSLRSRQDRAVLLMNWALLKSRRGNWAEAYPLRTAALRHLRAILPAGSMNEVIMRANLADNLVMLNRRPEARAMSDTAWVQFQAQTTPGPAYHVMILRILAQAAVGVGDAPQATRLLQAADRVVPSIPAAQRVAAQTPLALTWAALAAVRGDSADAMRRYRAALDTTRTLSGANSAPALLALGKLAQFERARGQGAHADSLLADSVRLASADARIKK